MPRPLSSEEIQEFRDALCRVAERLFAEHGYGGVTLRAMARELGCSAMTPYRYFENKEAIFTAVRTKAFIRHGEVFEKIAGEHRDPLERLRAYAYAYVGFARDEPHAYRIMFEIAGVDEATARDALKRAAHKLPIKTAFAARDVAGTGDTE